MASIRAGISRPGDDIDRLALRISLADIDEQFEKILQKSLVFILKYLSKYEDHRKKLMELLGDITRRLRCRPNIQVPVYELFLSYNDPSNSVFLVNFSHMYIRLGFPRLPIQQKIKLIPVLFASLSDEKPVYQRDGLLHLVLPVIDSLTNDLSPHDLCFNELLYQRRYISDFFSLVLLLPYNFQKLIRSDRSDAVIPDGYSSYDLGRMLHDQFSYITSAEELEKFKVSIMTFYTRRFFPVEESIIPILFGYGDSRHSVVSVAAKELRTLSILVDWEDESLLTQILAWYLGRRRDFDPKGRNEPRRPLSPNMRIKLGHYLMRSRITFPGPLASSLVEAAVLALEPSSVAQSNIFPNSGQRHPPNCNYTSIENGPISDADSGTYPQTPSRTQTEETICANSPANTPGSCSASFTQQRRLAEHGLDLLSHLINNMTTLNGSASLAALRCLINFVYERTTDELTYVRARGFEILSRYLARDPNHLLKDPTQLPRLFDVLSEDNPVEVKLAAAHCLRRLAVTLHNAQKQNYLAIRGQLVKLERLLYENIEKPDPLSRLVAVNFAGLIYPSDHIPTRYLILQALGDIDPRVRAEACVAFEQFLDPNIIHDIVYGRIKLPSFVEFVNHDTQHSRKNPFVEVERLIPVVQFIRLCLLATRGGLTPAQEAGLNYETEEEVRFLINQTVRYFLSAGNSTTVSQASLAINNTSATVSTNSTTNPVSACSNVPVINPEQAKRSIDTYFRLIQVVIFTRSQHTKDSPDFPNYLEEVLVGNTKELITCNKQLFDRMNNVLLATPRGASCRHACASVYSVVVMETESPAQALQTAKGMLAALPSCNAVIDEESSHAVQGMFMGAAYLLERLFTAYVVPFRFSGVSSISNKQFSTELTKKGKREKQQNQNNLQADIMQTIEELLRLMDSFLVKPSQLVDSSKINNTKATVNDVGVCYVNSSVSQATVVSLLEALVVIGRAGCLSHLSPGTLPIAGNSTISLMNSKATFVHRIMSYLPTVTEEHSSSLLRYPRVAQAALRTLAAVCMGEGYQTIKDEVSNSSGSKPADNSEPRRHPHTISIMKIMVGTAEINDPSLHLSVGTALADCILGPLSPYKFHWYERNYPLVIPRDSLIAAVTGPNVRWLAGHLRSLLVRLPGQVQTRPATIAATLWILNLVRRLGPLPKSLLSYQLLIDLLDEKDESLQCVAVATLGLIYDKSSEEERSELISSLTQAIGDDKRSFSPVYHELFTLAHQIGRSDLALSLIVLAIALPSTRQTIASSNPQPGSNFSNIAYNLASSVTYSSLVRRLGRSLAPALPRLVPRVFVRRFDFARPKLRQAMENVWLGLVLYATNSTIPFLSSNTSYANLSVGVSSSSSILISPTNQNTQLSSSPTPNSIHSLASEMVEAHFNAIVCEIKTQLGFNTLNFHATHIGSNSPQSTSNVSNVSGTLSTNRVTSNTVSQVNGTVTQNIRLRDACCLAISSLATHPSADKRLAGHLPALLSGLLSLCDECESSDILENDNAGITTPAEEAAITVQKLVIRVLENPCSREAANGLLPGLLPVVIERAPWSLTSQTSNKNGRQPPGELQRLALELLLAAARTARPSALRPALPQLVLSGLRAMSSIHPSVVANLMRQPIHHLHIYSHASPNSSNLTSTSLSVPSVSLPVGVSQSISPTHQPSLSPLNSVSAYKEVQMAEVLRLCVRLLDDICLSRLIVPFTELIKAGGSSSSVSIDGNCSVGSSGTATGSASIATAVCVFIIHLAATNTNAISVSPKTPTCMRCAASRSQLVANGLDNSNGSPSQKAYNSPSGSSHSSPSSLYGLSPPTPPCSTAYEVSTHSLSSGAIDSLTFGNRSRILLQNQKHNSTANGSFNVLDGTTFTSPFSSNQANSVCCNSTGGGFASLAPHTGKLLAALLSALPGACRHPNSSGKVIQEEMAKTLAILLRFAKDTSVIKLFNRVRSWYLQPEQSTASSDGGVHDGSSISISHWACVRVLHAVAHHCPDLLYAHAGITLPLVFLSKQVEGEVESLICSRESSSPIFHSRNRGVNINFLRHEANINVSTNNNGSISAKMNSTDVEIYQQLWQECWEELISRITSAPCSPHSVLFWPNSVTLGLKSVLPLANGLANSFLRRPLLDHSTKLLYDALLESPSWSVRNQASFAILQLAYRMLGQPFSTSNTSVGKRNRCSGRPLTKVVHETSPVAVINPGSVKISQESLKSDDRENPNVKCTSVEVSGDEAEIQEILEQQILNLEENEILNDDNDGFSDDVGEDDDIMVENETSSGHAWLILVQLTATALSKCTPWPGKIYLLRATRALAEFAFEQRSIIEEPVNQDVIRQMWCTLLRETQPKSAEGVKAGYQAEAFLTFASFAEACGRDAIAVNHPHSVVNNDPDGSFSMKPPVDCLSNLFVLIIPQWLKRWKNSAQNKNIENLKLNTKLNDLELEYAVRAVGIMWPINSTKEHLSRFAETIILLNSVMTQSGKRVQVASLGSALAILAKLSPEQSAYIVDSTCKSALRFLSELGLKELLVKIKKMAENQKSHLLREQALGTIAGLLRHPSFINLCKDSTRQLLQSFSNDSIQALRDWAAELLGSL